MGPLVPLALIGWLPFVGVLFAMLPARRAVIAALVLGWLFLPEASYRIEGPLPDYSKVTVTCLAPLAAVALVDPRRLWSLRLCWIDLPVVVWCVSPFASSLSNGLGAYDGVSVILSHTILWGVPYALGRAYLADTAGLSELAVGVFVGGLLYLPLCLVETVTGPQWHRLVYGFTTEEVKGPRFGGWRPVVFMQNGLMVAVWLTAASLSGAWLWIAGVRRRLAGVPTPWWVVALTVTTLLTRSLNAWVLIFLGGVVLWPLRPRRSHLRGGAPSWLPLACVLALPAGYVAARATNLWTGRPLVPLARLVSSDRAHSIEYRIESESALVQRAQQRPWLGWGGWGRAEIAAPLGHYGTIRDSLWILAFGDQGSVGLISVMATLLLPTAGLWWRRQPGQWSQPSLAPAAVLGLILILYTIDCCFNAMVNPVYMLAAGGLSGFVSGPECLPTPSDA